MLPIDCEYFHTELARTTSSLLYKPEPRALSHRDLHERHGKHRRPAVS